MKMGNILSTHVRKIRDFFIDKNVLLHIIISNYIMQDDDGDMERPFLALQRAAGCCKGSGRSLSRHPGVPS